MIIELAILALLIGFVSGGKLTRLADAKIKYGWMIFVPIALYAVSWTPTVVNSSFLLGALAVIEKLALVTVVIANRHWWGWALILLGLALNLAALSANGGMMPADARAIAVACGRSYAETSKTATHVRSAIMDKNSRFPMLCDIIPSRKFFLFVPAVYSVGDVVMTLGICLAIIGIMRTPLPGEKRQLPKEAHLDTQRE